MMEHGGTHLPSRSRWLLATLIGAALVMEARPSSAVLACCLTWQSWRQLMCSPPPSAAPRRISYGWGWVRRVWPRE
jgi:hypothetical protein